MHCGCHLQEVSAELQFCGPVGPSAALEQATGHMLRERPLPLSHHTAPKWVAASSSPSLGAMTTAGGPLIGPDNNTIYRLIRNPHRSR